MGVPGFFAWLLRHNVKKNIVLKELPNKASGLYIDANCLFHPQCFKVLHFYPNEINVKKLETMMIKRIINYINYLIDYVNPADVIYIAVDGVAPVAKINQQRKRRYKSIIDNEIKYNIYDKYKKQCNRNWSNIVITPGTEFMIKLDVQLSKFSKTNNKIIYSSFKDVGEGEHKILQYIKNNIDKQTESTNVIYGLDADLIFLTFASDLNNLYLLREQSQLDKKFKQVEVIDLDPIKDVKEPLSYVSIDNTISTLNEYITEKLTMSVLGNNKLTNFKDDFIFLCYFLGNDFIPHIPSIDIKMDGLDILIDAYVHAVERTGCYLISDKNKLKINETTFKLFMSYLVECEKDFFKITMPKYFSKQKTCRATNDLDRELWEIENMIELERYLSVDKKELELDPFYLTSPQVELNKSKNKYYNHHFNIKLRDDKEIEKIVDSYYKILFWTMDYYFNKCKSWKTQYEYNHAPFITEIYKHIDKLNTYQFNDEPAITISQQLISVIPSYYKSIIPIDIRKYYSNEKLIHMLPNNFKLDFHYKDLFWTVNPILPFLDINLIEKNINF